GRARRPVGVAAPRADSADCGRHGEEGGRGQEDDSGEEGRAGQEDGAGEEGRGGRLRRGTRPRGGGPGREGRGRMTSPGSLVPAAARVPVLIVIVGAAWLHVAAPASAADAGPAVGGGDVTVATVMAPGSLVISVPLRQSPLAGKLQPIVVTDNRT